MIRDDEKIIAAGYALLAVGTLLAAGCSSPAPPRRFQAVVLVTVDTLRADRLGVYGYPRPTSPTIDALAREATVFDAATSTCPATAPSVASILTGVYRARHRVLANNYVLPDEVETVAEILKAHGFHTAARVGNLVIDANLGFGQGFDDFVMPAGLPRDGPAMFEGAPLVAEVEPLIDALAGKPFFLWIHLMDPHGPYFPPERYRQAFDPADYRWPGDEALRIGDTNYGLFRLPKYQLVGDESSANVYRARYDGEIRYTDDHIAAIVRKLRASGAWDQTLFILTADHGESLGEHSYFFQHGWYAYDDTLRVPLLIHAPDVFPAGRRVTESVSLVDIVPTILDILGLPVPAHVEGATLRTQVGGEATDRPAYAQAYYGAGLVALRRGSLKYVFTPSGTNEARSSPPGLLRGREELYDLAADPHETVDLSATRQTVLHEMRDQVQRWFDAQEEHAAGRVAERKEPAPSPPVTFVGDPQIERQLRALGYLD